ncbi:hypothetical protein EVAR_86567_1 [Eumeta japonica]|uniref:Uncharacterized protein n=1 Tax=Eumeta variegata TaxID=151549 RepID=A0A4C2A6Z5_EUMVA|nr:hypothetical protein EVAR_86567_1 [Eumeta japonica]
MTVYNGFEERKMLGHVNISATNYVMVACLPLRTKNIDAVRCMTKIDRYGTYHEIRASLGIGASQIQSILHKHLGMLAVDPRNLIEAQKMGRVTWRNARHEGASNLV